jgi:hypothetical protein
MTERDVWRFARTLVTHKGAEATAVAEERIATLQARGEHRRVASWVAIADAIAFLVTTAAPTDGERVH